METARELDLPVDHKSVREARQFVANFDGLMPDRLADAQLITSELVTNALQHAGLCATDWIQLTFARHGNRMRIDVQTLGTFTADSDTFAYSAGRNRGGRGLRIVKNLAVRWQAIDGHVTAWLDV